MASRDNPQAYITVDRRRSLAQGRGLPDRVHGSALFLDISGFTSLTEALLAQVGTRRGADVVGEVLERVFESVLDRVHRWGGDAISFSGDAVTCWFDGDDGLRAAACGLQIQDVMGTVGRVPTASGGSAELRAKVAIAVGGARRFVVGDSRVQLIEVLAGRLVDQLAAADGLARTGEVVLNASAVRSLGDAAVLRPARREGDAAVLERLALPVDPPDALPLPPPLPDDVVRQWLLPAVYQRMRAGRGEFLNELRPAVPLFLNFSGIDYDDDDKAPEALDAFVVAAQSVVDAYGGSTLQLTLGDKGAYLYAVFGSPRSHGDDAARACAAATDLLALEGRTAARRLRIGIALGRLRSGTYGHPQRRTFCCLGDAVNLAARLMSAAPAGQIYVSGPVRAATKTLFAWRDLPPLKLKGKAEPAPVARLLGPASRSGEPATPAALRFTGPLLGRDSELATLRQLSDDVMSGRGRLVEIVAEAGLGKSRLVAEVVRGLARSGVGVHATEAAASCLTTSYLAWRDVWWSLLGLTAVQGKPTAEVADAVAQRVARADPSLQPRAPLLGAVLGVDLPDSDLTRTLDAKLRKTSLEDLLARLLREQARRSPLAVVLEDAHWMDPLSVDLLAVLARTVTELPVLLVLSRRPGDGPRAEPDHLFDARVVLGPLDVSVSRELVRLRAPDLPARLVDRVVQRAQGNPFYVEELVTYVQTHPDAADADLPDSLSSLVLMRIDALSETARRAAKVASVVGRSFAPKDLGSVHPELGSPPVVTRAVARLRQAELATLDDPGTRMHSFRHVLIREVAYESLPDAIRARLHEAVGDYLSADGSSGGDQRLDLLAYHYGNASDADKKRTALLAAGRAAQARYANLTAIAHYEAVLPLLSGSAAGEVLLNLGQVLELTGEWTRAEASYTAARDHAVAEQDRAAAARAEAAIAEIARKQGRFPDADAGLTLAAQGFDAVGDEAGTARVLHLRGTLHAQQGDYEKARAAYSTSLQIRERLQDRPGTAALLSNLAVVAEYTGDYDEALALNERALAVRLEVGDKWAIGVSQNNLGMIALLRSDLVEARRRFTEAMRLNVDVGDPWMVAIAHNNLANTLRDLGDPAAALHHYVEAVDGYRRCDDTWAIAILLEDVAVAAVETDKSVVARRLLGAATALRNRLGSPRAPAQEAALRQRLSRLGLGGHDDVLDAGELLDSASAAQIVRVLANDLSRLDG